MLESTTTSTYLMSSLDVLKGYCSTGVFLKYPKCITVLFKYMYRISQRHMWPFARFKMTPIPKRAKKKKSSNFKTKFASTIINKIKLNVNDVVLILIIAVPKYLCTDCAKNGSFGLLIWPIKK